MNVCGLRLGRPSRLAQLIGACAVLCEPGGAWLSGTEVVCVWMAGVAGLGGIAQQSRDRASLCRPGGEAGGTEIVCVFIPGLAGLRGTGLWNGYCAGLCRPGGHS
jgi:hypothetical protein